MGSNTYKSAVCTTRSRTAGIPKGRFSFLPSLVIHTRFTGKGWYLSSLSCRCSAAVIWLKLLSRVLQLTPSTPAQPSRLITAHAASCRWFISQTLSIKLCHFPPVIPLSRVANMRSVQTALLPSESLLAPARFAPTALGISATLAGSVWLGLSILLLPSCLPSLTRLSRAPSLLWRL